MAFRSGFVGRGADELAASTLRIDPESAPIPPLDRSTPLVPRPKRLSRPTTFLYLLFPYAIMPSPDACEQCVATLSRNEQKNARHGGTVAWWHGGTVARWHGGTMARWHDGTMARWARWHGGTVARVARLTMARWLRWHDGTMARWHDGRILRQILRPCPLHEKWRRFAVVNDGFANVSESENSDLGLCCQNPVDSTEKEPDDRSQPQISAIFPYLGTRFSQVEWAFHKKWTPACASAQNQTSLPTGH